VSSALSKGLIQRGFKQPTPIQRASLPLSLGSPARDVLGMARTGSGKTLAYLIPLIQRLAASTARTDGPRALILCPSRELAVQVLKVGKDLARGAKEGSSSGAGRMRWSLIIGGEALDKQFATMSSGPDM
jgi:ATP-dependent RNA helicase DDX54/DBP10